MGHWNNSKSFEKANRIAPVSCCFSVLTASERAEYLQFLKLPLLPKKASDFENCKYSVRIVGGGEIRGLVLIGAALVSICSSQGH